MSPGAAPSPLTAGDPPAGEGGPQAGGGPRRTLDLDPSSPRSGTVRLRLTVAYDGSGFHGFAAQPGQRTVAGALAAALETVAGHPVALTCAGRTDAGVHAWGQVVHADVADLVRSRPGQPGRPLDPARLARACNAMLGPAVVVRDARVAAPGFDARRSALSRCYRYTILNGPVPDPALAARAWHVTAPLDCRAMEAATDPVLGEHDFAAFCRRPAADRPAGGGRAAEDGRPAGGGVGEQLRPGRPAGPGPGGRSGGTVRRVLQARWSVGEVPAGRLLCLEIEAVAFCHQMVRSLVGTLAKVGHGRLRAGDLSWILRAGDRSLAASPAPPHGLCLWAVRYPDPFGG